MKSILSLALVSLILALTSCTQKGAYTYSGVLVDSCANPIANAKIHVYAGSSGDDETYTDGKGYFIVSGSWREKATFLSKDIFPEMNITYPGSDYHSTIFEWLPKGNHSLGKIAVHTASRFYVVLDTSDYNCKDCYLDLSIYQPGAVFFPNKYGERYNIEGELKITTEPQLLKSNSPILINGTSNVVESPVFLELNRWDSVSYTYPEIDITSSIKLCGQTGDTVFIKL